METSPSPSPASAPNFLNDDGSASMASMLMMSHHAFRRDIAQLAIALRKLAAGERANAVALQEEWKSYHAALHGHHTVEDERMFPDLRKHAELAAVIDRLGADHRQIDPLLERGDRAFAELTTNVQEAAAVVTELSALLTSHLALEEAHVTPFLREAKGFPPPGSEAEAEMYAQGFAWSAHGVAPDVLARVFELLPPILTAKLPAARAAYEQRCERVWGSARAGASRTPVPDWI